MNNIKVHSLLTYFIMNLKSVLDEMATFEIVHDFLEDPSDIPGSSTSFVTDGEIAQYAKLSIPKNTMNKYKWASNLFERWYEKKINATMKVSMLNTCWRRKTMRDYRTC